MNIALIYPAYTEIYGDYKPAARIGVLYPPLGLSYLAATLEREGHKVTIIDMEAELLTKEQLEKRIGEIKPAVVGITSTTPIHHKADELFGFIKRIDKNIVTIAGGPHPTSIPNKTLEENKDIDIVIVGEGEKTVIELADKIEKNEDVSAVDGIFYRKGEEIKKTKPRELIQDLDWLPFPARHLLKQEIYVWGVPKKGIIQVTPIETTRGCPFKCSFCSQIVVFGNKIRERSVDNVIEEIKEIRDKYKITHLVFYDDTLGLNRKRTMELCDRIINEKIDITFEGMTRVNCIDEELIIKMKQAGLNRLSFGVESGNQDILNAIKKGINLQQIRDAYRLVDKHGIETRMSIIFGLPFETKETIKKTIKFMKSLKCYQAYVNIGTPFPGTEYYEMAKHGYGGLKLLTHDWREFRRWGNAVINVNDLTKEELIKWQKRALLEFYLRPRIIWYNLRRAGIKAAVKNVHGFVKSFVKKKAA
ncbi:cobalamin-dependent protein [Candidatus Woesearchaeota archaeon]|nr:cobalamin-dependent protein [Candidatus Woesearchaeota archaeon]